MKKVLSVVLILALLLSMTALASAKTEEKVVWGKKFNTPEFISGKLTTKSNEKAEDITVNYLLENKDKFNLKDISDKSFKLQDKGKDKLGFTYMRYQQMYNGVPVFGYTLTSHVKDGILTSVSGELVSDLGKYSKLKVGKKLNSKDAIYIAQNDLGFKPNYEVDPTSEIVVYMFNDEASYAYLVNLSFLVPEPGNWNYFIDAASGEIIDKYNNIQFAPKPSAGGKPSGGQDTIGTGTGVLGDTKEINTYLESSMYYLKDNTRGNGIQTYDAMYSTLLPGSLWDDTDNVLNADYDRAAVDAHYYLAKTYDYYFETFNRRSYDDRDALMKASVHFYRDYNNAFWDGRQMVFGDGDGVNYREFSAAVDVVAHELTHAVTDKTASLVYKNESGALNESISDIFGTAVEFYNGKSPDWLMGEDLSIKGNGFRSMSDPTVFGDPDHYSDRYIGSQDNGGVHWNSGIINKAAYLISEGGNHYGVNVTGIGLDKMTAIFYRSLTQYLTRNSSFSQARATAVQSAIDLYGSNSIEVKSVNDAFDSVGVY